MLRACEFWSAVLPEGQCGGAGFACNLLCDAGAEFCPRHQALVDAFGRDDAWHEEMAVQRRKDFERWAREICNVA